MRWLVIVIVSLFAAQPAHAATTQQAALQKLLEDGLLTGTDELKNNCDEPGASPDHMVCDQKGMLIAPLRALVAQNPRDYDANYFLGYLLRELGKPKEAIGPLTVAAEQHPEYQWSYSVLAQAYDDLGDQPKAISLMEASQRRPAAHFASDHDQGVAGSRYFDAFIWSDQIARQYRYYYLGGQPAKAAALLASHDERFRSTILKDMNKDNLSAMDLDNMGANILAQTGLGQMKAGDKAAARDSFLAAWRAAPVPDNAVLLGAVASMSFDLHRYGDAAWAYRGAADRGADLSAGSLLRLGVSNLVLGDYQSAAGAFDRAHAAAPGDSNIREWRVAAAFGLGGWQRALDTLIAAPPGNPEPRDFNEQRLRTFDIVYGAFKDADDRARSAGLRYPRLAHLSLLHELLSVEFGFGNVDKTALQHEKWTVAQQAMEIYRRLPLKPLPPKRAVDQEAAADLAVRAGRIEGPAFAAAVAATTIAPWWPEAHYNLAMYAQDSYYTINLDYDGERVTDRTRIAAQELMSYLRLDPNGPYAPAACRQLLEWKLQCPN